MSRRVFGKELNDILNISKVSVKEIDPYLTVHREFKILFPHEIIPGKCQPREHFDPNFLQELANSIKEKGILQPLIVRKLEDKYELIAGERRWRAAQIAGVKQIPVIICEIDDDQALACSLIENIQRQDLNPIEEALALKRLTEELSITHEAVAKSIGKSRTMVTNIMRLLNLAKSVQEMLIARQLEMGHARALLSLPLEQQTTLAKLVVAKKMTVRAVELKVRSLQEKNYSNVKNIKQSNLAEDVSQLVALEIELFKKLGLVTKIQLKTDGTGKFVCQFSNLNKLRSVLNKLNPSECL